MGDLGDGMTIGFRRAGCLEMEDEAIAAKDVGGRVEALANEFSEVEVVAELDADKDDEASAGAAAGAGAGAGAGALVLAVAVVDLAKAAAKGFIFA